MRYVFTWDGEKSQQNRRKHGVTFGEAISAFGDPMAVTVEDTEHSIGENRYILIGETVRGRLVVVSLTDVGGAVRIISARPVTKRERRGYEEGKEPG